MRWFSEAAGVPALVVVCWEAVVRLAQWLSISSTLFIVLPPPSEIAWMAVRLLARPEIQAAALRTLAVAAMGFALGLIGGGSLGVLLGSSSKARRRVAPSVHFLRSLPVVLYIPVALVLMGPDLRLPIALAAGVTALYGALPVMAAVRDYDPEKVLLLKARGVGRTKIFFGFMLPEIVAALGTSMSINLTLSIAVVVVTEMLLPGLGGLGSALIQAREASRYLDLWGVTLLLGLLGYGFHEGVLAIWKAATPWRGSMESG